MWSERDGAKLEASRKKVEKPSKSSPPKHERASVASVAAAIERAQSQHAAIIYAKPTIDLDAPLAEDAVRRDRAHAF